MERPAVFTVTEGVTCPCKLAAIVDLVAFTLSCSPFLLCPQNHGFLPDRAHLICFASDSGCLSVLPTVLLNNLGSSQQFLPSPSCFHVLLTAGEKAAAIPLHSGPASCSLRGICTQVSLSCVPGAEVLNILCGKTFYWWVRICNKLSLYRENEKLFSP